MSVISVSASPISVLQPLQEKTLELRDGCTEFEQALEALFHDIDQMRSELTDQMEGLERERTQLKLREVQLGQRQQGDQQEIQRFKEALAQRDLQLAKALDDLQAAREELTRQRAREAASAAEQASDLTAQLAALQTSMEDMQRESRALECERDGLQESARQSAAHVSRIADLEQDLTEVRQQLERAQRCAAEVTSGPAAGTDDVNALALTALEQEREALESELELVRSHAAELNETVAQQQREIAAQKSELSTELQQLRKLVEKQADLIADRVVVARETAPPAGTSPTVAPKAADPVVNSVMAQFAKLQKDVAQRRRRKA